MEEQLEIQAIYGLTPMQKGMLFHQLLDTGSDSYFQQFTYSLDGELDITTFEKSINLVVDRYDVFRTNFVYEKINQPRQVVFKKRPVKILFKDLSNLSEEAQQTALTKLKTEDRLRGFNLSKDNLIRVTVVQKGTMEFWVIWSFHHIIMDGWCMGIVIQELFTFYQSFKEQIPVFPEPATPYVYYIRWLENQNPEEALAFWKKYLDGYQQLTGLPGNFPKTEPRSETGEVVFQLDPGLTKKLKSIAAQNMVTMSTLVQTIWGVLLQKYNCISDVAFGIVVSGRPPVIEGIEKMVGLFINTLPVRIRRTGTGTFLEMLIDLQKRSLTATNYEYAALAEIQSRTDLKQHLLDHLFVFENYPVEKEVSLFSTSAGPVLKATLVDIFEQTNYNFYLTVMLTEELNLFFRYKTTVYTKEIMNRVAGHFHQVARQVAAQPEISLAAIEILSKEETKQLKMGFNNTKDQFTKLQTINAVFEEQAAQNDIRVALRFGKQQLTYQELNQKANQLGRVLRALGVKKDDLVAIMAERSLEMVVGILAILKAGGAYLPISAAYPEERINFMLNDSRTKLLLFYIHSGDTTLSFQTSTVRPINLGDQSLYTGDSDNLENINVPGDLAYVLYTSGSTGKPKGVMVEHAGVANLLYTLQRKYPVLESDSYMLKTTYLFDVSVTELFGWFLGGGSLVILEEGAEKDPLLILDAIKTNQVTHVNFVPSMLKVFLDSMDRETFMNDNHLKYVFIAGEAVSRDLVNKFHRLTNEVKLENLYGPTEATVYATQYSLEDHPEISTVPIGKPLTNVEIYIFNLDNQLQPVGIMGELAIGGVGLARGYLNQPELTAQQFIPNPFNGFQLNNRSRLYKTGDLARWLPDGNIEFFGRLDQQVKIRGFRVELGEIEARLRSHQDVKEAVIVDQTDQNGNKYLCAYLITGQDLKSPEIKAFLSKTLPDYMIPARFIRLPNLPVNVSGKINRRALPDPSQIVDWGEEYEAPRSAIEEQLVKIWQEILGPINIGRKDSFFDRGGNSLLLIQLYNRLEHFYPGQTSIAQLFAFPTIQKMATLIRKDSPKNPTLLLLRPITILPEFQNDHHNVTSGSVFTFQIQPDFLEKIKEFANLRQVELSLLFLALLFYILAEITEQSEITIQIMVGDFHRIASLSVNTDEVNKYQDLLELVSRKKLALTEADYYDIEDLHEMNLNREQASIVPFFYLKQKMTRKIIPIGAYDFLFEIDDSAAGITIKLEYNPRKFLKEKIEGLVTRYFQLLASFVGKAS